MRALVLSLAALAAVSAAPTTGLAQTQAISRNPSSATGQPAPDGRTGAPSAAERGHRDGGRGEGRRERPVVIVFSPLGGYGDAAGGYYADGVERSAFTVGGLGSTATTRYTGTYAPLESRIPARVPDTTVIRVETVAAAPAASAVDVTATSPAAISIALDRPASSLLRLRWTGRATAGREVTLVVADANRRVLATQTVRGAPYTAVFDDGARIAFVGTTVVRPDGVSTTTLVPVGRVARPHSELPPIRRTS